MAGYYGTLPPRLPNFGTWPKIRPERLGGYNPGVRPAVCSSSAQAGK